MLYRNLILSAVLVAGLIASSSAQACSYYINQIQKKNELTAAAATHLGLELSVVSKSSVEGFSWVESKPTPMCPEEMTFDGTVTLEYLDPTATFPRSCVSQLAVKKIEDWKTHLEEFTFESVDTSCN